MHECCTFASQLPTMSFFKRWFKSADNQDAPVYRGYGAVRKVLLLVNDSLDEHLWKGVADALVKSNKQVEVVIWSLKGNKKSPHLIPGDIFFGKIKKERIAQIWSNEYDLLIDLSIFSHGKIKKLLSKKKDVVLCGIQELHADLYSLYIPVKGDNYAGSIDTLMKYLTTINTPKQHEL
jgi:hypothetical protein